MARGKQSVFKLNDSVGFMSMDAILDSDDEELQSEFFKYLDNMNEFENSSRGIGRSLDLMEANYGFNG